MIAEHILRDTNRLSKLNTALGILSEINFFGVLLEIGANRSSVNSNPDHPMENAALNSAWHSGYVEALKDMYEFQPRYASQTSSEPRQDFGAREELLKAGDLRPNE